MLEYIQIQHSFTNVALSKYLYTMHTELTPAHYVMGFEIVRYRCNNPRKVIQKIQTTINQYRHH